MTEDDTTTGCDSHYHLNLPEEIFRWDMILGGALLLALLSGTLLYLSSFLVFQTKEKPLSNKQSQPQNKRVSFDRVQERQYRMTLGNHPDVTRGVPVQLAWDYEPQPDVDISEGEFQNQSVTSQASSHASSSDTSGATPATHNGSQVQILSAEKRQRIALQHHSFDSVRNVLEDMQHIQWQRQQSQQIMKEENDNHDNEEPLTNSGESDRSIQIPEENDDDHDQGVALRDPSVPTAILDKKKPATPKHYHTHHHHHKSPQPQQQQHYHGKGGSLLPATILAHARQGSVPRHHGPHVVAAGGRTQKKHTTS